MGIDIDIKYKIPLVGDYNAEIYVCPCCGKNVLHGFQNHIIGFADYGVGTGELPTS